jgi:hypothetical protein
MKNWLLGLALLLAACAPLVVKNEPDRPEPPASTIQAVYLAQDQSRLSQGDLKAHSEVVLVHSFDDFKRLAQTKVALWIDREAVKLVNDQWLHQEPQKYYPLVLIGYNKPVCAFRETFTGFGIEGPAADCSITSFQTGFSVWMLRADRPATIAFMGL